MADQTGAQQEKTDVGLTDVPETMLWTLHNRVSVALQPDGFLQDPKACEIYQLIEYDYEKSFGPAESSHAVRSWLFDHAIKDFLDRHPDGTVVNLGDGLETQRFRVQHNESTLWVSVDLPSAIEAREKFIQPDKCHLHIATSALDLDSWAKHLPKDKPVFITAQGLFMYFEEEDVQKLFKDMNKRLPGSTMMFDNISKWLSNKTVQGEGWKRTPSYTAPRMPFGVNRFDAPVLFKTWVPGIDVKEVRWPTEKMTSVWRYLSPILNAIPVVRGYIPGMVFRVQFKNV